ncbi:MAG: hypothetical protein ABH873_01355 [Candidatus Firestonebacteria bacterium]
MIKFKKIKGNVIMTVVLLMAIFAILIPFIVIYVRNEVNWTTKEKRQTIAFHLAEAGLDRGHWKLIENSANWTTIIGGGTIAGYANDVVYSDINGGYYKINIERVSATEVSITATAKDTAGKEFRAIKAVYYKGSIVSPIQVPSYSATGNFTVWWGPIYSLGSLTISGASDRPYPRKMARGKIDPRDTDPNSPNIDSNPNPEWWSYNSYPVPDPPVPDLAWYKAQSIAQGTYYPAFQSFSGNDPVSRIRWCEAGGEIAAVNSFLKGYIFSMGNFSITKKGYSNLTVTPPANAWKEYAKVAPGNVAGDTAAQDEYPGDGGYQTVKSYIIGSGVAGGPNKNPSFSGFLYVAGTFSGGANACIYGAIVVASGGGFGGGGADLFYDDTLTVQFSSGTGGTNTSWQEITPTPF